MKNILTILIAVITLNSTAQNDSTYIVKNVDDMSGQIMYIASRDIVISNSEGTKGFIIDAFIDDQNKFHSLMAVSVGIGGCNENDEIIILFKSGERIIKKSWNKFNCDGDSWFMFSNAELELLKTTEISRMRITNGRSFESYTGTLDKNQSRYFIQLFKSL